MEDFPLSFENATLQHNNLGGLGPDNGPECLCVGNVGLLNDSTAISMELTVAEGFQYFAHTKQNQLQNGILYINLINGGHTMLNVTLVDGAGKPVTLPRFFITVLDIDAANLTGNGTDPDQSEGVEVVTLTDYSNYFVKPGRNIIVNEKHNALRLTANNTGTYADNPATPYNLTGKQLHKAALVEFRNVSTFTVRLAVTEEHTSKGRNFQLTGVSDMITAPFGECSRANFLRLGQATVVYNNLDGKKAGRREMVFQHALEYGGLSVDLAVILKGGRYNPGTPGNNGMFGRLGKVNLGYNDSADFVFEFRSTESSEPIIIKNLFVSFFDLDNDNTGHGYEKLTMLTGGGTYFLPSTSTVTGRIGASGEPVFVSGSFGTADNNPRDVDVANENEAVTFFFEEPMTHFKINYEVSSNGPRNFMFGSVATAACKTLETQELGPTEEDQMKRVYEKKNVTWRGERLLLPLVPLGVGMSMFFFAVYEGQEEAFTILQAGP